MGVCQIFFTSAVVMVTNWPFSNILYILHKQVRCHIWVTTPTQVTICCNSHLPILEVVMVTRKPFSDLYCIDRLDFVSWRNLQPFSLQNYETLWIDSCTKDNVSQFTFAHFCCCLFMSFSLFMLGKIQMVLFLWITSHCFPH